jgi:hypothetical protein
MVVAAAPEEEDIAAEVEEEVAMALIPSRIDARRP